MRKIVCDMCNQIIDQNDRMVHIKGSAFIVVHHSGKDPTQIPLIEEDTHFCSVNCFERWLRKMKAIQ